MARYWFELWEPPWATTFERKALAQAAQLPVQGWQADVNLDRAREAAKVTLPLSWAHLAELLYVDDQDHANDVAGTLRLFRSDGTAGGRAVASYVIARRAERLVDQATGMAEVVGRSLTAAALESAVVYPFDYPTQPSAMDNWEFGAEPIAGDGAEAGPTGQEEWLLLLDATGGTFTLTVTGVETTAAISWTSDTAVMATRIDSALTALTYFAGVEVEPAGAGDPAGETYRIVPTDPSTISPGLTIDDLGLTDGYTELAITTTAVEGVPSYVQARSLVTGDLFGQYATSQGFELATSPTYPVRTGTYSLRVSGVSGFVGPQLELTNLTPGEIVRVDAWVFTDSLVDTFRISVRDQQEQLVGWSTPGTPSPNPSGWAQYQLTFITPADATRIAIRFTYDGPGNPDTFWVDDFTVSTGQPATTWGGIWEQLLADVQTDHSADPRGVLLDWLVPTFDDVNDSDGTPWAESLSVTIPEGATYLQVAELGRNRWGFETQVRYDDTTSTFYLDIFQSGGLGQTRGAGSTLIDGQGIQDGERVMSAPAGNAVLVRGAAGAWAEQADASSIGVWDRMERYLRASDVTDGLAAMASQQLQELLDATIGLQYTLHDDGAVQPFDDLDVGDLVPVTPASSTGLPAATRRVQALKVSGVGGAAAGVDVHTVSEVFGSWGMAAQAEAIRRIVRRLRAGTDLAGSSATGAEPLTPAGSLPWLVAAADAPQVWKDVAGFVCDGVDDSVTFQECIDAQQADGEAFVQLSPGYFVFQATGVNSATLVTGGINGTAIHGSGAGGSGSYISVQGTAGDLERVFEDCSIADLWLQDDTAATNGMIGVMVQSWGYVRNSVVASTGIAVTVDGADNITISDNILMSMGASTSIYQRACISIIGTPQQLNIRGNFLDGNSSARLISADNIGGRVGIHITDNEGWAAGNGDGGAAFTFISSSLVTDRDGLVVVNNRLYDFAIGSGDGIYCENLRYARIAGNEFNDCYFHGIHMVGGVNNEITGNLVVGPSREDPGVYDGIFLGADESRALVKGNTVVPDSDMRYGINVSAASCANNVVVDNWLGAEASYLTASFNNAGTGTITTRDANGQFTY